MLNHIVNCEYQPENVKKEALEKKSTYSDSRKSPRRSRTAQYSDSDSMYTADHWVPPMPPALNFPGIVGPSSLPGPSNHPGALQVYAPHAGSPIPGFPLSGRDSPVISVFPSDSVSQISSPPVSALGSGRPISRQTSLSIHSSQARNTGGRRYSAAPVEPPVIHTFLLSSLRMLMR